MQENRKDSKRVQQISRHEVEISRSLVGGLCKLISRIRRVKIFSDTPIVNA